MTSAAPDTREFALIVAEVDPAMIEEASESLAEAFRLDPAVAQQVVRSAPIVFARGLSRHEIKAITPKLILLSKMGLELRVTARSTGKMRKLNWPIKPQFTAGDSGGMKVTPTFDWQDSAFVCPSCGETFVFKRLGQLELGETPSEDAAAPATPGAEEPAANSNDSYTVTLPTVSDPAKADKAAELIARYQGISVDEARQLTSQPVISVAKNLSRTDAQLILEEFKRYRLFGRMSKAK